MIGKEEGGPAPSGEREGLALRVRSMERKAVMGTCPGCDVDPLVRGHFQDCPLIQAAEVLLSLSKDERSETPEPKAEGP